MKKFLEKYAEWLALAVGLAFVGIIVYFYGMSTPAVVKFPGNNKEVTAGEVDPEVKKVLDVLIAMPSTPPKLDKSDPLGVIKTLVNPGSTVLIASAGSVWDSPGPAIKPGDLPLETAHPGLLPDLSQLKATFVALAQGRSIVKQPVPNLQPGAPLVELDKVWVSIVWTYPFDDAVKQFITAQIPANLQTPVALQVQFGRQEKLANGWGPRTIIKTVGYNPDVLDPLPTNSKEQLSYSGFADKNQGTILRPPFYQWLRGDPYNKPALPAPPAPALGAGGIPPVALPPTPAPVFPPPAAGGVPPVAPGPAAMPADLKEVWVHDDTAEEGKTYQYSIRVVLRNPLFGTTTKAKNQADAAIFALPQDPNQGWSDPTPEVAIPLRTHFFVANVPLSGPGQIALFEWKSGATVRTMLNVSPGDAIAGTGWAVAEAHTIKTLSRNNDYVVTFINSAGERRTQSYTSDQKPYAAAQAAIAPPPPPPGPGGTVAPPVPVPLRPLP